MMTPDLLIEQGAWIMALEAIYDGDPLRVTAALNHLALIDQLYGESR